jgi:trehalose synthase
MMSALLLGGRMNVTLQEVEVKALTLERLHALIGPERTQAFEATAAKARAALRGRTVWNINSTATGGGVAEMLQILLAYARGAGITTRWLVIQGDARFFEITKRLHNNLYGTPGDGGPLGPAERFDYDATLERNARDVLDLVRPGDIVILHDPQPAGLAETVRGAGAHLVWRCHIGVDTPNEYSDRGWAFLRPHLEGADGYVFSCRHFAPSWIPTERLAVIAPSIDPFSSKNVDLGREIVIKLLRFVGLLAHDGHDSGADFVRRNGSHARVTRKVELHDTGPPPPADVPLVVQISRWDALKDMAGVLEGFAARVADRTDAHLVLAGPQASGVADDPEAAEVLQACLGLWSSLPSSLQRRTHLASIPMVDTDENATIINALQRHSTVVVQKSLAEGFGLTVAEAMWKTRPVVATAIGGITDQIVQGETGWLLDDGRDLDQYANAVFTLLSDPAQRSRMGENARRRALEHFLGDRHLEQWAELFARFDGSG